MNHPGTKRIEDYRSGYPRFTALLSAHPPWFIFRRFDRLRARILLLKQDGLSALEQQLDRIDQDENAPLFLGQSRCDGNLDRLSILSQIEIAMADYDQFIMKSSEIMSLQSAEDRDIESLQHWVEGTGSLARTETEYLLHRHEVISIVPVIDSAVSRLETWIEDKLVPYWDSLRSSQYHHLSSDPNVYVYTGSLIKRIGKSLLFTLITVLLMLPVVVCNFIAAMPARIIIVILSTSSYLLIFSWLTKSKTTELIVAGATYATVLIVFVSGTTVAQV